MRIIVVEDDMQLRERLARALRARGHDAVVAADRAAARMEAERSFDAAVVDLRLGPDSGLEVISDLLAAQVTARVVLATSLATLEIVDEASRRGAVGVLRKPYDADQLLDLIAGRSLDG
ncbi:MAG: two-component system response regulator [Myxococcales bacterium]|nr:two-component system response regulator [Myxococcales bacterium]